MCSSVGILGNQEKSLRNRMGQGIHGVESRSSRFVSDFSVPLATNESVLTNNQNQCSPVHSLVRLVRSTVFLFEYELLVVHVDLVARTVPPYTVRPYRYAVMYEPRATRYSARVQLYTMNSTLY